MANFIQAPLDHFKKNEEKSTSEIYQLSLKKEVASKLINISSGRLLTYMIKSGLDSEDSNHPVYLLWKYLRKLANRTIPNLDDIAHVKEYGIFIQCINEYIETLEESIQGKTE